MIYLKTKVFLWMLIMPNVLDSGSFHFRTSGKIELPRNLHCILPNAEPQDTPSTADPIEWISSYFWSCWRHWLHRLWLKWQRSCSSSPALLLGLSEVGWLGSKPRSYTCRRVLGDRSWRHFLGHGPMLSRRKKKSRLEQDLINERCHLGRFLVSQLISK